MDKRGVFSAAGMMCADIEAPSAVPGQSWRCSVWWRETMRAVADIGQNQPLANDRSGAFNHVDDPGWHTYANGPFYNQATQRREHEPAMNWHGFFCVSGIFAERQRSCLLVMIAVAATAAMGLALAFVGSGQCGLASTCSSECRTVDSELIERAVTREASRLGIESDRSSVVRFIAEHPACCSVSRQADTPGDAMAPTPESDFRILVHLKFDIPPNQSSFYDLPHYHLRVEFDRCGRMGDSYGEQVKSIN